MRSQDTDDATLAKLYLGAMRHHRRRAALLQYTETPDVRDVPDWRLDRQVIRAALYMRERLGVQAGQTIAVLAPFVPASLVADLAVITSGAVSAFIPPSFSDAALADALAALTPEVVFVADATQLERARRLRWLSSDRERAIVFDEPPGEGYTSWTEVLDFGGTLDTAERANAFRARARAVVPSAPAIAHPRVDADGRLHCATLTHAAAVERVTALQHARADGVAPSIRHFDSALTLDGRLLLYACLTDGTTTAAFGATPEQRDAPAAAAAHRQTRSRGWRAVFDRRLSS